MALVPCPECKRRISETAESCPNCGYILTPEEVTKIKEIRKKRPTQIIGFLVLLAPFVVIAILANLHSRESATTGTWQEPTKSSTDVSTFSFQFQLPETDEIEQRQAAENEAWLGTWSLESIGGFSTEQHLAGSLKDDKFVSWNWTFNVSGEFESKLVQDTGNGIITSTISGTYVVYESTYGILQIKAIMSMGETKVPISDEMRYQPGTWSRTDDTLTLIPADSPTKVFKRIY